MKLFSVEIDVITRMSLLALSLVVVACGNNQSTSSVRDHVVDSSQARADFNAGFYGTNPWDALGPMRSELSSDARMLLRVGGYLQDYDKNVVFDRYNRKMIGLVDSSVAQGKNVRKDSAGLVKLAIGKWEPLQLKLGNQCEVSFRAPLYSADSTVQAGWALNKGEVYSSSGERYDNCDSDHIKSTSEGIRVQDGGAMTGITLEICDGESANMCDLLVTNGINEQGAEVVTSAVIKQK